MNDKYCIGNVIFKNIIYYNYYYMQSVGRDQAFIFVSGSVVILKHEKDKLLQSYRNKSKIANRLIYLIHSMYIMLEAKKKKILSYI